MFALPRRAFLGALFALAPAASAFAQGTVHTPRVHAITGARIITEPGRVLESGTLVIRDGLVEAVGASVTIPGDARIWEADSLTVYPGLIDPAVKVETPESGDEDVETLDHDLASVQPQRRLVQGLPLGEEGRARHRDAGFTTLRAVPGDGIFRGESVVLNTGDGGLGGNLLDADGGQVIAFSSHKKEYPGSLMGAVAVIRQTLHDARWFDAAMTAYEASPRGLERPDQNAAFAALRPVVRGETRPLFLTGDVLDLLRAQDIAREFGLTFEYLGSGEEYKRLTEALPGLDRVLLPVNFPGAPEEEGLQVSLEKLRHWDAAPSNPDQVYRGGATVAFTAFGMKNVADFREKVGQAIEAGFPEDRALAACTTVPAAMLGLTEQVGTLAPGMIANLVVTDGDLFDRETTVREVWVDGDRYEVEALEPPVGDPRGTWEFTATASGTEYSGKLVVGGEIGSLTAVVTVMGAEIDARAHQSGRNLVVTLSASKLEMDGTIRLSVALDGDRAGGAGTSPMGDFAIVMNRIEEHQTGEPGGRSQR